MTPCANIIAKNSPTGCGACSRPSDRRRGAEARPLGDQRLAESRISREWTGRVRRYRHAYSPYAIRSLRGEPYVVASPQLAASPLHRGHRAAIPRREALILQAVINHPWLLHEHLEELAALEFRHSETARSKGALIDIFAHGGAPDAETMAAELAGRGLAELAGSYSEGHHHALGVGRRAAGGSGGCADDLETACRLASAVAFPN